MSNPDCHPEPFSTDTQTTKTALHCEGTLCLPKSRVRDPIVVRVTVLMALAGLKSRRLVVLYRSLHRSLLFRYSFPMQAIFLSMRDPKISAEKPSEFDWLVYDAHCHLRVRDVIEGSKMASISVWCASFLLLLLLLLLPDSYFSRSQPVFHLESHPPNPGFPLSRSHRH